MNRRSQRSGIGLAIAGLVGAMFFCLTDPRFAVMVGLQTGTPDLIDRINQNRPGTLVGLVGCLIVVCVGFWLASRRTT